MQLRHRVWARLHQYDVCPLQSAPCRIKVRACAEQCIYTPFVSSLRVIVSIILATISIIMSDAARTMQQLSRGNLNKVHILKSIAASSLLDGFAQVLVGGVAAVTAGLGLFWYAQQTNQTRKETSSHPGATSTCALRACNKRYCY